jgi:hypothetical protein
MKGFLAAVGVMMAIAAIILSIAGWHHIVILGTPFGISILFWIGYRLYQTR